MTEFSSLKLAEPLQRALADKGYTTPTPIQSQAIPLALAGRDVLGIAQTGTGKTAAFALPILDRFSRQNAVAGPRMARCLVLAPTRELAAQIAENFTAYARHVPLSVTTVFGGTSINKQINALRRGVDVLVATPGRLLDLVSQKALSLDAVEVLVLDEADQMLDLGFIHDLKKIVKLVPAKRQTLFFSATMPKSIADLAARYLTDPQEVSVTPAATTAEKVDQQGVYVPKSRKQALLTLVMRDLDFDRALIFSRTKHGADKIVRYLEAAGIESNAIHGNKSQPQRERALDAFRDGSCRILIATDIAARGVDVPGVSHVINYDMPNVAEQYVHRIGRTARAGAAGLAMSFVAPDERPYLRDIEKLTRQKLVMRDLPESFDEDVAEIEALKPAPRKRGPSGGHRRGSGGRSRRGPPRRRSAA